MLPNHCATNYRRRRSLLRLPHPCRLNRTAHGRQSSFDLTALEIAAPLVTIAPMIELQTATPALLAAVEGGEVPNFPLSYRIACAVLIALFIWAFSIARDPRGWRRLYQVLFTRKEEFSVNRNKRMDEIIKKRGIVVAMAFLTTAVALFVLGVTYRHRHTQAQLTQGEKFRMEDSQRVIDYAEQEAARRRARQ